MSQEFPQLLVADQKGKIFNVPFLEACGMKARQFFLFQKNHLRELPPCSQLMMLPDRSPVAFDHETQSFVHLDKNPLSPGEKCYPVAAFLAPGHTAVFSAAFLEEKNAQPLPLFAYTSVVFYKEKFYVPSICVDRELRQDSRYMDLEVMGRNITAFKKKFPENRLIVHLEHCACVSGCPAAKNFFLKRYEAPLPTSPTCNCQCLGCISYQPGKKIPVTQPRITFVPAPEEIAEVALMHIKNVRDPVVSFGQGCEGEPLMEAETIKKSIQIIRAQTSKGIINLNTNASKPDAVAQLCDAGLDSIRVSMNSVREEYYHRYYQPRGYTWDDVVSSIRIAKRKKKFISLNYFVMPGFTDTRQEYQVFQKFIRRYSIDMIQWRNLNFDPRVYFQKLQYDVAPDQLMGMDAVIRSIHQDFSALMRGYFNPSKDRIRRHRARSK